MNESINDFFDMPNNTVILDGVDLDALPRLPVSTDLRIVIRNPKNMKRLKKLLIDEYPAEHSIALISEKAKKKLQIIDLPEEDERDSERTVLIIPPNLKTNSFSSLQNIVAILRGPDGCPWDKKQTHQSLRDDFLQEAYELIDGLDRNDHTLIMEELGDVLLHIVMQAQIASENREFTMGDVIFHICEKMIFRHQHIFSTRENLTSDEVLDRWEKIKRTEREKENREQGLLDGISKTMPALSMAFSYQKRAAKVGFDWQDQADVWKKLDEEICECKNALTSNEKEEEFGDMLFTMVNLARWEKVDPETALRLANNKFLERVHYVESCAKKMGKNLFDMPLDEKDRYWDEFKAQKGAKNPLA